MKKILRKSFISCFLLFQIVLFSLSLNAQPQIGYQLVTSGLSNPVDVVTAPGDNRMFIAQQNGVVKIWDGTVLTDFINLSSVITPSPAGEQGLLSIVFHPAYNLNRYFFVWYTNTAGAVTLARYQRDNTNPDIADYGSAQVLLTIAKPGAPYFTNHNGGKLNFGPDGMLYIGTGDGGDGGDPFNNAQSGNSLLGKMLRLDVSSFATSEPLYDIPADNPFLAAGDGIRDEIYAVGLRNPWRWSFDRSTGDMWLADVGQGAWEELNFLPAGSTAGVNFGWRCYEGAHVYAGGGCSLSDTVSPVFEYGHNATTGGFSITGGYVYRGPDPANASLLGSYIAVDYISNNLWLIKPDGAGGFTSTQQSGLLNNISGFGEGADGTLYALRRSNGSLYKVIVTGVLPVTITSLEAAGFNGYNQLQWATSSELNVKKYHVEFSSNGQAFTRVGAVDALGNSTTAKYSFRHMGSGFGQTIFYRLAMEDVDGSVRYSNIVRLKADAKLIKVYPTFVTNGLINVTINTPLKMLQLISSTGAIVFQKNMQGLSGNIPVALPLLPKGLYIVRAIGNDFSLQEKIIIN
jgi:glucose/arabinose dehydrogenase